MANETKALEVQKDEMLPAEGTERTRESRVFIPRADIYEVNEDIFVIVVLPGVDKDNLEISLEKNVLTINGYVQQEPPEGYALAYAEYEIGDYERSFRLSGQIDRDGIEATYKNGSLRLNLPKSAVAKTRKISVKAG